MIWLDNIHDYDELLEAVQNNPGERNNPFKGSWYGQDEWREAATELVWSGRGGACFLPREHLLKGVTLYSAALTRFFRSSHICLDDLDFIRNVLEVQWIKHSANRSNITGYISGMAHHHRSCQYLRLIGRIDFLHRNFPR